MSRKNFLLIVSAPSGGGKTTLCKKLIESLPDIKLSVSYTTRTPRSGEINGNDYFFISGKRFREMKSKGAFAEWALVHGNYYGTTLKNVKEAMDRGNDLVLAIDTQGATKARKKFKNSLLVFVIPSSLKELEKRLKSRNADSFEEIEKRLKAALKEIKCIPRYDYLIINDNIHSALSELKSIVIAERIKVSRIKEKKFSLKNLL
ncbi:MAG: guanylate kinase [Candidatus Schekmanbacteria bacterium GWA2_38_9]|uniref:Guanylate kinase n=1 Tax=Candidatus Schekmanbacteria bacterium RIFCSPLOWO2_12_FULL_38_15 TaxID=1817883 RepID=A0A1F7SJK6_9BACT|nr:MAG: guanylate kinase [Candidatus Schekmanbacteria bacterium GWA2_38_9]OGL50493.1 MAG: guanylate kinase [Candidatus Schekmanbacteria bacterium RIFCSPLOWO2_02_FULL_38_14]OGL53949.1 MAG: guanylate kinase [Candidatus Schekmanbacteria bacterium RIFCSPLOWO2_12_FULL_38_15]